MAVPAAPVVPFRPTRRHLRLPPALRHRNFRLFWTGQLVSLVGTWMQSVAQAWLVLSLTGDPFVLGLVAAVQFLPVLVFGLVGGVVADQLPKRPTLVATQSAAMILAFVLGALTATGVVAVPHVLALAFLLGCVNAVDMPTRQAFVVEMVGRDAVVNAVALNSAIFNAARIVGPALAGLIIGATGIAVAFVLNGLSFLAVIAGLLLMRPEELHPAPTLARPEGLAELAEQLAEGLRYVRRTPPVLLAVAVVGVVSTAGMNFSVIVPVVAQEVLRVGATGYGFLMAASGLGALTAAGLLAAVGRSEPWVIVLGGGLLGALEVAFGFSGSFPLSLVLLYGVGLGGIAMTATANSTIQLSTPDRLRGRVLSVYTTIFAGSTPLGSLAVGAIAGAAGAPVAAAAGGLVSLAAAIAGGLWWRRRAPRGRRLARPAPGLSRAPGVGGGASLGTDGPAISAPGRRVAEPVGEAEEPQHRLGR